MNLVAKVCYHQKNEFLSLLLRTNSWLSIFNSGVRYEATSTKFKRDIFKELLVSLVASVFMGFGVLFLLLWVGIYV